ncbi:hypothetical protein ABPG75_004495 [Micractinium tetrahymenae]
MAGSLNITNFTVLDFYTEPRPRLLYQANLCRMVNRVNTITGVPYRLDPTIFAWEVMNEPRCPGCFNTSDEDGLFNWLAEVTSFLKCIDQNHLVSVGLEGHYGASSPWRFPDMPGAWALCQGQDYDRLLQLPAVDYGVAHAYEAMRGNWDEFRREYCGWEECILPWLGAWIRGHLNESRALGRPFLLEEFNYPYNETRRNQMFRMVQDIFRDDIAVHPDSAAAGAMFWLPALAGQPDTDGLNIYLDGTLAGPPPEGIYGEKQSAATTEFLGAVRRMEEDVRMRLPAQSCMDQAKLAYRAVYDLPGLKNYSSASTVELLAELAADSAAFAAEVAAELAGELAQHLAPAGTAPRPAAPLSPSAEAAGAAAAGPGPEGGPPGQAATCTGDPSASCEALGELPFDEWAEAQEALNASQAAASWAWPGASPLLPAVDWPAVAETVCNCLLEAAAAPPPSAPGGSVGAAADDTSSGFVRRQGNLLVLDGQPLFFVGFDAPALPQWAYRDWPGDLAAVDALFANASSLGFTVGRMFVPGEGRDLRLPTQRQLAEPFGDVWTSLQPEAGVFDEEVFRALDFVLDSAARHGIKLILVLGSTDSQLGLKDATFGIAAGTPLTYMQWAAGSLNVTGATMLDFYTDPRARLLFKNFLCTLASRANSFSGVAYRDDPTIFSWELLQAPRCPACPGPSKGTVLTEWAAEMAGFLKCIDGNHLVSVAQLGGFGDASPEVRATDNPALDTECDGADFLALTTLEAVDYGTMQMTDSYFGYVSTFLPLLANACCCRSRFGPCLHSMCLPCSSIACTTCSRCPSSPFDVRSIPSPNQKFLPFRLPASPFHLPALPRSAGRGHPVILRLGLPPALVPPLAHLPHPRQPGRAGETPAGHVCQQDIPRRRAEPAVGAGGQCAGRGPAGGGPRQCRRGGVLRHRQCAQPDGLGRGLDLSGWLAAGAGARQDLPLSSRGGGFPGCCQLDAGGL